MYVDDIVLIADSELKFESLSRRLGQQWVLSLVLLNRKLSISKTKSVERSTAIFLCGEINIESIHRYKYLG